jgi:hypothetical protein
MIVSRPCFTAEHPAVALSDEGRKRFHSICKGACLGARGELHICRCECHENAEEEAAEALGRDALLPPAVSVSPGDPVGGHKDPPGGHVRPNGRCEHCGAPTGGRFAPGHDAKLKSDLWKGASGGNYKDYAELVLRGWVEKTKSDRLPVTVIVDGENFAQQIGPQLIERRNRVRVEEGP